MPESKTPRFNYSSPSLEFEKQTGSDPLDLAQPTMTDLFRLVALSADAIYDHLTAIRQKLEGDYRPAISSSVGHEDSDEVNSD